MCSNDKKLEAALMMEKDVYDITYQGRPGFLGIRYSGAF